jgi:hypothetical protein
MAHYRELSAPEVSDYLNGYTSYDSVIETDHGVLVAEGV